MDRWLTAQHGRKKCWTASTPGDTRGGAEAAEAAPSFRKLGPIVQAQGVVMAKNQRQSAAGKLERNPERFYCPYPNCTRSFAELWRLKVQPLCPARQAYQKAGGQNMSALTALIT